ncbi:MAG: hypothetical protein J6V23_02850 [Bacteroidaceae bacterium]|nr:hypothetical protein [Bacteroidaceae bacterium]
MKKNLFLTLALAVASFAGVNAQGWSLSLGAGDGLPGENVQKGTQTVQVYKSDVITPSEPLTTLRFTVALNYNGEKPSGNNFVTALSELVVYAADGTTVIPYTATSNADHNTLSGGTDGAGLAALNDGNWGNYWHSCWSGTGAQADYHHLELTFEAPVSEFILEWGARPGNPKNAPLLVGLTKGGVDYVPYSDWAFNVGDEITSMDQLEGVKYFVMKSNVPVEYHTYVNNHNSTEGAFGTQTTKEPNVGPGPLYVAPGVQAEEAAPSYAIQLIPADGGYYLYYVAEGKFLSKNPSDNAYNGANGGQGKTAKMSDAAIVNIEEVDGRFEMSYMMEYEGEEVEIHVGATPSTGGFKNVDKDRYDFYKEGHPYCLQYAYILAFDWTLYEVTMDYPAKYATIPVRNAIKEAKSIYTYMDSVEVEGYEEYYDEFLAVLKTAQDLVTTGTEDIEEVFSTVDELNYAMAMYVYSKVEWASIYYSSEGEFCNEDGVYYGELLTPRSNPQEGYYIQEVWTSCIEINILEKAAEIMYHDDMVNNPYSLLNTMKNFINSIEGNVETFLASKVEYITLPKVYTAEDPHNTPLGTKVDNHWDWEQSIALNEAVDGIRLTFLETNVGNAASDGKFKNYPMVALSGLEILNVDNEKIALTTELTSTNSLETSEGSIANLYDDDVTTFYHSIWGNGTMNPETYVYLDIKFPEGTSLQNFTIKTIGRNNASLAPGTVCVTKYGEEYDPAIFRENPYNVKGGTQITDVAQLKDGGLYIISGNLRVKTQQANPRYYSGNAPYHTNIQAALNDPCVYMFKKTANGWNIISLSKAQYWALNKTVTEEKNEETQEVTVSKSWSTGLTVYPANAAEVNFVKSGNLENTFVIYSDIEDNNIEASWNWTNSKDTTDVVNVEKGEVNANKFVFMDWDGNLAGRPCVSAIPGEFTYGLDVLSKHGKIEEFKNGDGYSAGDYLHFNKANGEGEWNIYEVTMDDPYYLWANGIPATLSSLGLVVGKDPGCIAGDVTALEAAVEAVEAVVENEDKENAEKAVLEFDENIGVAQSVERVKVEDGYYYAIESAYTEYFKQQNKIKAIFAGANGLEWKDAPAAYNFEETPEFIFKFELYTGTDFEIPEGEEENTFLISSEYNESYLGSGGGTTQVSFTDDFGALAYIVKPLETNIYTIYAIGSDPLHTAGHGNGAGASGTVVNWTGGVGSCSSWILRFVDDAEKSSISDLVVEGDEVVSVAYFTPAGAAIPAPVSGINIVVTVYSNGVIETKKVLVK